MAWVTPQFVATWASGDHIGRNRPKQVVQVRKGRWARNYRDWPGPPLRATIPGEDPMQPWRPRYFPHSEWMEVPNVTSVEFTNSFDQKGCKVATVVFDNVDYIVQTGPLGDMFHLIQQGYLSPFRGYDPATRAAPAEAKNQWYQIIAEAVAIRVWQGFGEPERDAGGQIPLNGGSNGAWVFHGLADSADLDSGPATATLVARMGTILTDEHVFGFSKSRQIKDPITFMDRVEASNIRSTEIVADARTWSDKFHRPSMVGDDDPQTSWTSKDHSGSVEWDWVEIGVPEGSYGAFAIDGVTAGLTVSVAVHGELLADGSLPSVDNVPFGPGWYDPNNQRAPDLKPIIKTFSSNSTGNIGLGANFILGRNSRIRLYFQKPNTFAFWLVNVQTFKARQRLLVSDAKKFVLVDDLSDVVRVTLRWAGYEEWEVEDTGVRLDGKMVFNRADYLMSIIDRCVELTGFVFFIADPVDGASWGRPTFRRNSSVLRAPGALVSDVRDTDLITGLRTRIDNAARAYVIRVRGKEDNHAGVGVGGDPIKRLMAVYAPPWAPVGIAGVIKRIIYTNDAFKTAADCWMGCYLVAVYQALAAYVGTCEIPANPNIELDDQVGLLSTETGTNSRLWISSTTSTMTTGENTAWKMTLEGSLIDNPDLDQIIAQIDQAVQNWSSGTAPYIDPAKNPLLAAGRERRLR